MTLVASLSNTHAKERDTKMLRTNCGAPPLAEGQHSETNVTLPPPHTHSLQDATTLENTLSGDLPNYKKYKNKNTNKYRKTVPTN